jgi:hypothetical protein
VTQIFEPAERSGVAMPIQCERSAAHRAPRAVPRFVRRNPQARIIVLEHREMRRHLAREVVIDARVAKERDDARQKSSHAEPAVQEFIGSGFRFELNHERELEPER